MNQGEVHRTLDRLDIGFHRAFGPGCVDAQYRHNAVAMLLGDPEDILADHQVPAH